MTKKETEEMAEMKAQLEVAQQQGKPTATKHTDKLKARALEQSKKEFTKFGDLDAYDKSLTSIVAQDGDLDRIAGVPGDQAVKIAREIGEDLGSSYIDTYMYGYQGLMNHKKMTKAGMSNDSSAL